MPSNGPFQCGTGHRFSDFIDGLSNTLLIGEKHVPQGKLGVGWWDCSTYNGDYPQCSTRPAGRLAPLTTNGKDLGFKFGSLHTQVAQCGFMACHGGPISESVDPSMLDLLTTIGHGQVTPDF